jgi:hypothetical protein
MTVTGYRGGYAPFHAAVEELAKRGVYDPSEVTDYVSKGTLAKFKNDEMEIPFKDGYFTGVSFKRMGLDKLVLSFDTEDGSDVLFVETFNLESTYTNSLLWDVGTGDMEITANGNKIEIFTVCHQGEESSSDFNKPRRTFKLIRRGHPQAPTGAYKKYSLKAIR